MHTHAVKNCMYFFDHFIGRYPSYITRGSMSLLLDLFLPGSQYRRLINPSPSHQLKVLTNADSTFQKNSRGNVFPSSTEPAAAKACSNKGALRRHLYINICFGSSLQMSQCFRICELLFRCYFVMVIYSVLSFCSFARLSCHTTPLRRLQQDNIQGYSKIQGEDPGWTSLTFCLCAYSRGLTI